MTDHAEVIKIDGAPGVGKTTKLQEYVAEERAAGRNLTDLYYLTFARASREDSAEALSEVFPDTDPEDVRKRAKTFHGAALTACLYADVFTDLNRQLITQRQDSQYFEEFCQRHGLQYVGEKGNVLKKIRNGDDLEGVGDRLFAVENWLALKQYDVSEYHRAPQTLPWCPDRAEELLRAWRDFKRTFDDLPLFEHHDYVNTAIEQELTPPASVLFIDEFQDLAPQEYRLFKIWRDSGEIDRLYIAGDPNQSIYSFRAGTPLYFEETDTDETTVLKQSYRCPEEVASAARRILSSSVETDPRGFRGRSAGGEVRRTTLTDPSDVASRVASLAAGEGDVFCLARTNYHAYKIQQALQAGDVPHSWIGRRSSAWEGDIEELLRALRTLKSESGRVWSDPARALRAAAPRAVEWSKELRADVGSGFAPDKIRDAFGTDDVVDIAQQLDLRKTQRELLVAALTADHDLAPSDVRVGTIHSSKGLEADTVFLFDGYTSTLQSAYRNDTDVQAEEHRLYYVGATRAEQRLEVVDGLFDSDAPPLEVVA